ncbi:CRISPR-associated ring nuclease Csm6 [Thermodesulfovibrio hydrogeniphilus]
MINFNNFPKMSEGLKNTLIFVAGATPQIITETLYALAMQNPPIYPDELYVITTRIGKRLIEQTLFQRDILKKLQDEYSLPPIPFNEESFIVVKNKNGEELDDIRNSEDSEALGDLITSFIREKAQDISCRLLCSLAGGRKTMSFYMGSALQLFGRPWDKLFHVLVTPEFESNPDFFYKPKEQQIINCRLPDGTVKKLSTDKAEIELIELPFIRLRDKLSLKSNNFSDLVREGQREIDTSTIQKELLINLKERAIYIGEIAIDMIPTQILIYNAILQAKKKNCKHPERPYCFDCTDCWLTIQDLTSRATAEEMAKWYAEIYEGKPLKAEEFLSRWKDGLTFEVVRQNISKINKAIKEELDDETLLPFYIISSVKKYGGTRYGLRLEKEKII